MNVLTQTIRVFVASFALLALGACQGSSVTLTKSSGQTSNASPPKPLSNGLRHPAPSSVSPRRDAISLGADGVSLDFLADLIQIKNITSVDALIPELPANFLKDYTFVYNSRSLQDASPEYPRTLVYGTTAKTVISFNGSPDQKGYYSLEAMEFDDDSKEFVFQEITFPKPGDKGGVQFSERNPQKCLSCHGDPARPIYDNYPTWPGFYGVFKTVTAGSKDDLNFRNFIANSVKNKNRYSSLPNLGVVNSGTDQDHYQKISDVDPATSYTMQLPGTNPNPEQGGNQADNLGKLLLWYNYERVHADLSHAENYAQIKYALLAVMGKCLNFESDPSGGAFIPGALGTSMNERNESFANVTNETAQIVQRYIDQKVKRIQSWDPKENIGTADENNWVGDIKKRFLPLRFVLMSLGMDILDWPMTLETSDSFGADQGNAEFFGAILLQDSINEVPELKTATLYDNLDFGSGPVGKGLSALSEVQCAALKAKSLAALTNYSSPITSPPSSTSPNQTLERCASCHDSDHGKAPPIPFAHLDQLKAMLGEESPTLLDKIETRIRARDFTRMPLGQPLTSDQILSLDQSLRTLAEPLPQK